jgi:hypothetical protein
MKHEYHLHIFAKFSNTIFHENPSSLGVELFHAERWMEGRTDRLDEANNFFSQFIPLMFV